ncbi:MAG: cytochrome c [Alphaproteobacteria bacterium]|nr:cytochrome c [Alphaproteobacteria bacterium]
MKKLSLLALALAATTVLTEVEMAFAQSPGATIEQRKAVMKGNGGAMKALGPMANGSQPWNQATAIQALDTLAKNGGETMTKLFPQGSGPTSGEKTAALPAIWEKWADFQAAAKGQADAATTLLALARANDEAGFKSGFAAMGRACGTCHEPFRAKQ